MINTHTCKLLQTHTKGHTFVTQEHIFNTLISILTLYVLDYVFSQSLLFLVLCFSGFVSGVLSNVFPFLIFYNLLALVLELYAFVSWSDFSSSWTRCSSFSIKFLLPIKKNVLDYVHEIIIIIFWGVGCKN